MKGHMMDKIISLFFILLLVSCGGTADNLTVGDQAPDFTLQDSENNSFTLSSFQNISPVVIYFYPKANTSGCTKQACGIRDDYSKFEETGINIFGVSVDSKADIQEFVEDYSLNFPLLSDESKEVAKTYGVLNNIGIASRITFIVNKEGKLTHIIKDVDIESHANQVFELAKELL
jgi:thioredoxin-dependent peroxiredoxin